MTTAVKPSSLHVLWRYSLEMLAETMDRVICIFQRKDSILSGKSGKDNPDVSKVELKRIYQ